MKKWNQTLPWDHGRNEMDGGRGRGDGGSSGNGFLPRDKVVLITESLEAPQDQVQPSGIWGHFALHEVTSGH